MTSSLTRRVLLAFIPLAALGCHGSSSGGSAPAADSPAAPTRPAPAVTAPDEAWTPPTSSDPVALETQKLVEHYWELVAAGDVAAFEPLVAGDMAAALERLKADKGGEAGLGEFYKSQPRFGTLGPGARIADDEYVVPCRLRRYRPKVNVRVKKIDGAWKLVELQTVRPPKR